MITFQTSAKKHYFSGSVRLIEKKIKDVRITSTIVFHNVGYFNIGLGSVIKNVSSSIFYQKKLYNSETEGLYVTFFVLAHSSMNRF